MKWFKTSKSAAGLPLLEADDQLRAKSLDVKLLSSNKTALGSLFLTNRHLIHIDQHRLAFEMPLSSVSNCILEQAGTEAVGSNLSSWNVYILLKKEWICSICSFVNVSSSQQCASCGVSIQPDAVIHEPSLNPVSQSLEPGECPQCTYINHQSLSFCEICGSPLRPQCLKHNSQLAFVLSGKDDHMLNLLRGLASSQTPSSTVSKVASLSIDDKLFGVQKLRKSSKQSHNEAQKLIEFAMQGRNELLSAKSQLLELSQSLGKTLGTPKLSDTNLRLLSTSGLTKPLASLDFIPTVAGANSPPAIAQELAGLLIGSNVLARVGGVLTLHDLYALYNRARGISLIDLKLLEDALSVCAELDLPLKCRVHESGLKVVESRGSFDRALAQLKHWIVTESHTVSWRASAGFSARDVSEKFGCSIAVATEELLVAESRGELCRDEHVTGLRFFTNLIGEYRGTTSGVAAE